MDLTLFLLSRRIYPILSHHQIFGPQTRPGRRSECPLCHTPRAFTTLRGRCHGSCRSCGRISWLKFLMHTDGLSPSEAFFRAAELAGLPIGSRAGIDLANVIRADRSADLLEETLAVCRRALQGSSSASALGRLLAHFGLDAGLARTLEIGAPPGGDRLAGALTERGFTLEEVTALELDRMAQDPWQLVLGYRDRAGALTGLVALDADGYLAGRRRYAFTRGTDLGVPLNAHQIAGSSLAIVCLDLLVAHLLDALDAGPVVGLRKRSFEEQLVALHGEGIRTFVLLADTGSMRALDAAGWALLALPDTVVFVLGPAAGGPDPRSVVGAAREGRAALDERIRTARPFLEWRVGRAVAPFDLSSPIERNEAVRAVHAVWGAAPMPHHQRALARAAAAVLDEPEDAVHARLRSISREEARRRLSSSYGSALGEAARLYMEGDLGGLRTHLARTGELTLRQSLEAEVAPMDVRWATHRIQAMAAALKTGYPELDEQVVILPSELVLVAARPSHGKTTFGLNVLLNALALDQMERLGRPYVLVSYEVNRELLLTKLLTRLTARYSFHEVLTHLRSGLRDDPIIEEARSRLDALGRRIYAMTSPGLTVEDLCESARVIRERHGAVGAVIIDYLQVVPIREPTVSKDHQVTRVIRALRELAQELDTVVVCLAQVNRPLSPQEGPRPLLSHIVESTAVEQECNTILMLYNEHVARVQSVTTREATDVADIEVIVRKYKYGAISGTVHLDFRMRTGEIRPRGTFSKELEI